MLVPYEIQKKLLPTCGELSRFLYKDLPVIDEENGLRIRLCEKLQKKLRSLEERRPFVFSRFPFNPKRSKRISQERSKCSSAVILVGEAQGKKKRW